MRYLRSVLYAFVVMLLVIVAFFPALFSLILEEVEHKKGDEQ